MGKLTYICKNDSDDRLCGGIFSVKWENVFFTVQHATPTRDQRSLSVPHWGRQSRTVSPDDSRSRLSCRARASSTTRTGRFRHFDDAGTCDYPLLSSLDAGQLRCMYACLWLQPSTLPPSVRVSRKEDEQARMDVRMTGTAIGLDCTRCAPMLASQCCAR